MITPYSNASYITTPSRSVIRCPNGKLVLIYRSISNNILYIKISSDNGSTWESTIAITGAATFSGFDFSVDNSNNIHVVYVYSSGGLYYLKYRKLTYTGGTWAVGGIVAVYSPAAGKSITYPSICNNTSGSNIYIAARYYNATNYREYIFKSSNSGVSFSAPEVGYDIDANSTRYALLVWKGSYPHLVLYSNFGGGNSLRHAYKSAAGWSAIANVDTSCNSAYYDAVLKSSGNIEVVYQTAAGIKHREYTDSWSAASVITADGSDSHPSVAAIDEDVYVFWIDNGSNDIYGKQYSFSGGAWGSTIVVFDESEYGVVPTLTKVDKGISQSVSSFVSLLWGFFQAIPSSFNIIEHSSAITGYSKDRHIVKTSDGDLVWFYQNGDGINYRISTDDGDTWGGSTFVDSTTSSQFDVIVDSSDNIHIVYTDISAVKYRKFVLLGASTERNVDSIDINDYPTICVDSNGRAWVAFRRKTGSNYQIFYRYSDSYGVSWSSAVDLSSVLSTTYNSLFPLLILVKDKPFFIYKFCSDLFYRRVLTGTTWTPITKIIDTGWYNWFWVPDFSAVSDGTNVYLTYQGSSYSVRYIKWNGSSWIDSTLIKEQYSILPVISYYGNKLWIVYTDILLSESDYKRKIVYKQYNGSIWDSNPTEIIGDKLYNNCPTIPEVSGQYLNVIWMQGVENQYLLENLNLLVVPAPSAPTIIDPIGGEAIQTLTPILDWDVGIDNQSAYQIIIYNQGTGATVYDSGKITSITTQAVVPGATLVWGITYQWKVRIWNEYDLDSDYSSPLALFKTSQAPIVTMTNPTCSGIVSENAPTITWTYFDNEGSPQNYYQFKIYEDDGITEVYDSGKIASANAYYELLAGILQNYTDYVFEITVWDGDGLTGVSSCLVTTGWDPPPTPVKTATSQPNSGNIRIDIENIIPIVDEWDVQLNRIYRRENGTTDWSLLDTVDIEECILGNFESNLSSWLNTGVAKTLSGTSGAAGTFREGLYGACIATTGVGLAVYTRSLSSVLDSSSITVSGIVGIWAYIVDKSKLGWIRFAFGQNSSNYYYKTILAAGLTNASWNYLYEHLAHLNQVGTPNRTAIAWMRLTVSGTAILPLCDLIWDSYRIWEPYITYTDYTAGNRLLGCNSAVERNLYDYGVSAYNEDGLVESVKDENLGESVTYPDTRNNWLVPIGDETNQIYFNIPRNATQDWKVRGMKEFYHPIGRRAPIERIMSEADYEQGTLTAIFDDCELGFDGVESIRDFIRYSPMLLKTYWGDVLYVALEEELDREYDDLTRKWYVTFSFREVTTE